MPAYVVDTWIANRPGRGAVLQRYLSMRKLKHLFTTSTLFLARLDRQEDLREGRWPAGVEALLFDQPVDQEQLRRRLEDERHRTYTSCWTMRREICSDLFEAYGATDGAAVLVTVESLLAALSDAEADLALGGVRYVDHVDDEWGRRHPWVNTLVLPFQKRTAWEWEQEVRVVHQVTTAEPLDHVAVPIRLDRLEATVVPGPTCDREALEDLVGGLAQVRLG